MSGAVDASICQTIGFGGPPFFCGPPSLRSAVCGLRCAVFLPSISSSLSQTDTVLNSEPYSRNAFWAREVARRLTTFCFVKAVGTTVFMTSFFWIYFHLLEHPYYPVAPMPLTAVDRWLAFMPEALPLYLSLWVYVSLPTALVKQWSDLLCHAAYVGALCLSGILVFLCWPTAVPTQDPSWGMGIAFLKGIDAAGNACPSLHVATAVFSMFWLAALLREIGVPRLLLWCNWLWCLGIVYSTMAIRQHVFLDVVAGGALGAIFGVLSLRHRHLLLRRRAAPVAAAVL